MKRTFASVFIIFFFIFIFSGFDAGVSAGGLAAAPEESCDASEGGIPEDSQINAQKEPGPQLFSETAVLIDADNGQVLFEKDMHKKMYPASITKILTALLAIEKGSPEQSLTMSERAVFSIERGSSHIALDMDEQITLEQAIFGISIASGNDAANGIAEHIGGSLENFAEMMNQRAIEAGAINSNFVNAHGLPDDNHYTTAYDMGMIMRACVAKPEFLRYFSDDLYEIPPTNKQPETRFLHNANCLINNVIECEGVVASKTGYTTAAGNTLITAARREGRMLIAVVMKSSGRNDKYYDTKALFDYGFNEFREIVIPADQLIKRSSGLSIEGIESETIYYSNSDISLYLHDNVGDQDIQIDYELPPDAGNNQEAFAVISLAEQADDGYMFGQLAVAKLDSTTKEHLTAAGTIAQAGQQTEPIGKAQNESITAKVEQDGKGMVKWIIAALGVVLIIVMYFVHKERRRRRRRRKLERLRQQYNIKPYRIDRNSKIL